MYKLFPCSLTVVLLSAAVIPFSAAAEKDFSYAGAKVKSVDTPTPHAEINPQKNITDILSPISSPVKEETPEIYFTADAMENDRELDTITATGNVNIIRDNLTVIADKVIYNQRDDIINAVGNVVLVEEDGSVVFSDFVELTDKMSQGTMENVKVIMKDKTQVAARKFRRLAKDNKIMENVVYSPCDVCENKEPLWQIKASKVRHDAENHDVYYNNAFVEIKGIPVFYTPFLSHPDPSVKRRSGFIPPTVGSNSYLGATLQPRYFWAIDEHQDLTFDPILSTDKGIVWSSIYNKYLYNGYMNLSGSFLRDSDNDSNRGNLFIKSRYEINDYWYADTDINYVSDKYYLRDLSMPQDDYSWLTSSARLQGFDNRSYAAFEGYYYKLLTNDLNDYDKPYVLPWFNYESYGETKKYGAYSKTNINFASVYREDEDSVQRLSMINSWNLPYTSPYGEKYRMVASVKSDIYYVDNYLNEDNERYNGSVARIFPQLGMEWRLPFVRATENSRQILEPVVVGVVAPTGGNKANKIPNEDSQDVELDDTNILDLDRYAGYDRNDTGSRISYGLNWSAYGERTGRTSIFLAQSYRFSKNESFAEAEGQKGYFSDYVGRIYAKPNDYFDFNYRFKLDRKTLDFNYNEFEVSFGPEMLKAYVSYIYLEDNKTSSVDSSTNREELYTGLQIGLSRDWSLRIYDRLDLSRETDQNLEYGGSITYEDECMKFVTNIRKDNSRDYYRRYRDNESDSSNYEISATFYLKTLGGAGSN